MALSVSHEPVHARQAPGSRCWWRINSAPGRHTYVDVVTTATVLENAAGGRSDGVHRSSRQLGEAAKMAVYVSAAGQADWRESGLPPGVLPPPLPPVAPVRPAPSGPPATPPKPAPKPPLRPRPAKRRRLRPSQDPSVSDPLAAAGAYDSPAGRKKPQTEDDRLTADVRQLFLGLPKDVFDPARVREPTATEQAAHREARRKRLARDGTEMSGKELRDATEACSGVRSDTPPLRSTGRTRTPPSRDRTRSRPSSRTSSASGGGRTSSGLPTAGAAG